MKIECFKDWSGRKGKSKKSVGLMERIEKELVLKAKRGKKLSL